MRSPPPVSRSRIAVRKPGSPRKICRCTQLSLVLCLSLFLFVLGVSFGVRFSQEVDEDELAGKRPWLAWTRNTFQKVISVSSRSRRLPPGLQGPKAENGVAASLRGKVMSDNGAAPISAGTAPVVDPPIGAASAASVLSTVSSPSIWGEVTGKALSFTGVSDAQELTGGAWVYLPSTGPESPSGTINMIMSNRASGCSRVDEEHRGYSFYVNNWESQSDRALVLEWQEGGVSGDGNCGRLSSQKGTIPYDTWVHVAFSLSTKEKKAMLFLNGSLLRSGVSKRTSGDLQVGLAAGTALNPWVLGNSLDRIYPFVGRISQVFLSSVVLTPRQLSLTASLVDAAGWATLAEAGQYEFLCVILLSGGELRDSSSGKGGGGAISALTLPSGLPTTQGLAMKVAGMSSKNPTLVIELLKETGLQAEGLQTLPSPEELAAAAERARVAEEAAVSLAKDLLPPEDGDPPRSRRPAPPTGPQLPQAIARGKLAWSGKKSASAFDFSDGGNQWVPKMMHDPLATGSVNDPAALAAGTFSDAVTAEELAASDIRGRERAEAVRGAMSHAWENYRTQAWGADELKPQSGRGENNWAGVGMTLVDSLDTLFVMGMMQEFNEAREWVSANLNYGNVGSISVFEVTIRCLGGLLAAYELSRDDLFLQKALDLGRRLMPAFNTPTGIPRATISLSSGAASNPGWTGGSSILSELGTLQVEFRYLSKASGNPEFAKAVERVIETLDKTKPPNGLYPIYISAESGSPTTSTVAFGALGDSFFEYLIKVWVQGGRKEAMYRRMYDAAMAGMTSILLKRSSPSNLAYIADYDGLNTQDKMDHLVCFVPGMLALGAYNSAGTPGEEFALRDLRNAKALAYTCWQMYERMATGISAEFVVFPGGADLQASDGAPFYILRPEAAEALFVMHQLTGNPVYREWGWKMFQAIDKYCKTKYGFGAHPDVRDTNRVPDDRMESFFLAETLKYLYMLQSPDHPISLDKYVFNTEAHPLSVWS